MPVQPVASQPIHVAVLAPIGRDARLLQQVVEACGHVATPYHGMERLTEMPPENLGTLLVTREGLTESVRSALRQLLLNQPNWSDLPVLLLVNDPCELPPLTICDENGDGGTHNILILQRPIRAASLKSAIASAAATRQRQYALRDMLEEVHELNETLEQRVDARTEQVRELAGALTMAEARERQRIAHLLHDDLQQVLVGLRMRLSMAQQLEGEAREEAMREADEMTKRSIQISRSLSTQLAPPVLQEEGLIAALQWLAEQLQADVGLTVHVQAEAQDTEILGRREVRTLLFQLVRELLLNVVKHAETDVAYLTLTRSHGRLLLRVRDEGKGFDPAEVEQSSGGFGLPSVRHRIELIGGAMHIYSHPSDGATIELHLPTSFDKSLGALTP